MHPSILTLTTAALAGLTLAAPATRRSFSAPTDQGFPSPSASQLSLIESAADGQLSNAPPPPSLNASSIPAFQLIAINEEFEAAFFASLIANITGDAPGYTLDSPKKKTELLDILTTVLAQEELHALNALGVLQHFNADVVPLPCQYVFPTTTLLDALALAETFTALVLGTLQDASQLLASNGDAGPVRAVASVIGQEGEQEGFYRILQAKKPSEKPFLTTGVAPYLLSWLNTVIMADSCPFDLSSIPIPIFPVLNVLSGSGGQDVEASDQTLTFSADLSGVDAASGYIGGNGDGLFVTYLTGQNMPVSEPVQNLRWSGNVVTLEAFFPFADNVMEGFSIAALTVGSGFGGPDELPAATLAAPGLIQVNDEVDPWDKE